MRGAPQTGYLPNEEFGFSLHKGAFVDALALRYRWELSLIPTHCVCGVKFTVQHVLSCPRGGYPSIRHNELRDVTASLLTEVRHDVKTEPDPQPLSGEVMSHVTANTTEGARLDIALNGFWGSRYERTYLDVRVFNPLATSNSNPSISNCYRKHENEKRELTSRGFARLSTRHLHLLFSQQQVGWENKEPHSTRGWLASLQTSGTNHTAPHYAGYAVAFPSLCSGLPSSAYVGPTPHVVTHQGIPSH